jgi:hypothetical protein
MRNVLAGVVLVLPLMVGCSPAYHYVHEADASTFARPGCRALLEPVHSEALMVGAMTEAQYVADKNSDSAGSYAQDKADSVALFQTKMVAEHPNLFTAGPPDNTFILRPVWMHWEPGYYAYVVNRPGIADFTVDVLTSAGQPIEQITFKGAALDFSSGGRMRGALKRGAAILSSYIEDKWACAKQ